MMDVEITFDKKNWESASNMSCILNKSGIMHNKNQGVNYSVIIKILSNSVSESLQNG